MKVKKFMVHDVITIYPDDPISKAVELMKEYQFRHLPVVDYDNNLVGLLTESDLRGLAMTGLDKDLTAKEVMVPDPITITPDTSLEEAALLIYHQKIGGLPVLVDGKVEGIITTADLVAALIQFMGILKTSSRIDVNLRDASSFDEVSRIIREHGGEIISVGIIEEEANKCLYSFRLELCDEEPIVDALEKSGYEVRRD